MSIVLNNYRLLQSQDSPPCPRLSLTLSLSRLLSDHPDGSTVSGCVLTDQCSTGTVEHIHLYYNIYRYISLYRIYDVHLNKYSAIPSRYLVLLFQVVSASSVEHTHVYITIYRNICTVSPNVGYVMYI